MKDFVAIDFETANGKPCSVCSVGAVIVQNGELRESFYSLIHPYPNYYSWYCQRVHGLDHCDTDDALYFPEVWAKLQSVVHNYFPTIEEGTVPFAAHNARFDEGCLKAAFEAYQMPYPYYLFRDTLTASRKFFGKALENHQLQTVAAACGYVLENHHHALADAEACAWIVREVF